MKKILGIGSLLLGSGWLLTQIYILSLYWKNLALEGKLSAVIGAIIPACMIALGIKWLKQSRQAAVDNEFSY